MAVCRDNELRVETLVKLFKAEKSILIFDELKNKRIFDGYIYQLYDYDIFNNLYVQEICMSFDYIGVKIDTSDREYEKFAEQHYS